MTPYQQLYETLGQLCPTLTLQTQVPLASHTTFSIGGPCPLMAFPSTQVELITCLHQAKELEIPCIPLGNGSNLLVADAGVEAFFLHTKQFSQILAQDSHQITVQSGILLGKLANFAAQEGLSGLEFAHGIPGSLGGGIVMNAGAYGGELKDVITQVTSYSLETQEIIARSPEELDFSYRHSLFSTKKEVVLSATLALTPAPKEEILAKMNKLSAQRKEKQPLNFPSCGSTFKRPPGHFAAALIDQCGLKGYTHGGAQVSPKHAGFVVNTGGATCADVLALVAHVTSTVHQQTGVSLELEVKILE